MFRTITALLVMLILLTGCASPGNNVTSTHSTPAISIQVQTTQALDASSVTPAVTQPAVAATLVQPTVAIPSTGSQVTAAPVETTQPGEASSAVASCTSPASLTPAETEGPYFKANSPERTSLLDAGITGTKLTLTGYVLTADCKPVANALLDFWQANAQGQYDNTGYTLRGHQYTDLNGRYQLETVVPGLYPGRTEHIHVKVQAPNEPLLTTQLFFPGVSNNDSDNIYNPALLINIQDNNNGTIQGTFNFIINGQ